MNTPASEVLIAALGIISMIAARLLDYYFPLGRLQSRRQIGEETTKKENDNDLSETRQGSRLRKALSRCSRSTHRF